MAWETFGSTTYAARTNTTITAPASIADGDILLMEFVRYGTAAPTFPAGWTIVTDFPYQYTDDTLLDVWWLWKRASGESGNYTITHSSASTQGWIGRASGRIATGDPVAVKSFTENTDFTTTLTAPTITTPVDDCDIAWLGCGYDAINGSTPPTGTTPTFTERLDGVLVYVATGTLASAGATGAKANSNPSTSDSVAGMIALLPVVAGGADQEPSLVGGKLVSGSLLLKHMVGN